MVVLEQADTNMTVITSPIARVTFLIFEVALSLGNSCFVNHNRVLADLN
jgi:hypothetical protein